MPSSGLPEALTCFWIVSLESDYNFCLTLSFIHLHSHTHQHIAPFPPKSQLEAITQRVHSVPFTFHRILRAFTSTILNMTGESLDHPYIARVELTHGTPLPVREHWEEVVQEQAAVGIVPLGPECEEANDPLSPAIRFLCEDFLPFHFNFTVDSDGDHLFPHSPTQTITHALRLGNLQPLIIPITQLSALLEERDLVTLGPGRNKCRPSKVKGSSHAGLLVTRTCTRTSWQGSRIQGKRAESPSK